MLTAFVCWKSLYFTFLFLFVLNKTVFLWAVLGFQKNWAGSTEFPYSWTVPACLTLPVELQPIDHTYFKVLVWLVRHVGPVSSPLLVSAWPWLILTLSSRLAPPWFFCLKNLVTVQRHWCPCLFMGPVWEYVQGRTWNLHISVPQASCPESRTSWATLMIVTVCLGEGEKGQRREGLLPWLHFQETMQSWAILFLYILENPQK